MKTNKSYSKRIKVSKNGKMTARRPGQNHFNARTTGRATQAKQRTNGFTLTNKSKSRFITA